LSATIELWSDDQEFLNCKQAAAFLGVSETSFYRIRMSKGIPHYLIGKQPKFRIADLNVFCENQRVNREGFVSNGHAALPSISKVRLRGR
jgi:hypothetical protein